MTDRSVHKGKQVVELSLSNKRNTVKESLELINNNHTFATVTFREKSSSAIWIIVCHLSRLYKRASKFGGTVVFSNTINRLHTILSSSLNPIIGLGSQQISTLHYTCYFWSTEYLGSHDGILFFLQFDQLNQSCSISRFPRHQRNQIAIAQNYRPIYEVRNVMVK